MPALKAKISPVEKALFESIACRIPQAMLISHPGRSVKNIDSSWAH